MKEKHIYNYCEEILSLAMQHTFLRIAIFPLEKLEKENKSNIIKFIFKILKLLLLKASFFFS